MDTDAFIFSFKPIKGLIESLNIFEEDFDLSHLDPGYELYSKDIKKRFGKIEIENSSRNRYR